MIPFTIIVLIIIIILMGISISTLKDKLEGWISPEEFEADRTREYKRLNERFESWKRGEDRKSVV